MTILYPPALTLLGIIPIGIIILIWRDQARRRAIQSIGNPELVEQLVAQVDLNRRRFKSIMWLLTLTSLIVALAHPIWGVTSEIVTVEGRAITFVVDISRSMDATDVNPSRLERAKLDVQRIVQSLKGNDFSIVAFAGEAFVYMPMTYDEHGIQTFITALSSKATSNQGTDIYSAISLATSKLVDYSVAEKHIIVMSDGENHQFSNLDGIRQAKDNNILIHTVGYGTLEGSQIPLVGSEGSVTGYQTDAGNAIVVSKLDSSTLADIANYAGGNYFTPDTIEDLIAQIAASTSNDLQQRTFTKSIERFGIFLLLALITLSLDIMIADNRRYI